MATKRKLTVKVPPPSEEDLDDHQLPVKLRRDRGWQDWLLRDYLRYWYLVGCFFLDVLVGLEVWRNVDAGLSTSIPLIVLTAMMLAEFLGFIALWGKNGRWKMRK